MRHGAAAPGPARVAADDACEQGVVLVDRPLAGRCDGQWRPERPHERQDLFLGPGGQHAAAGDDDRAFGRPEKAHGILDELWVGADPGGRVHRRRQLELRDVNGLGRHDVPRAADVHGPGAAGRRDPEPVGDELGDAGRHLQLAHPLRDRSEDGSAVDVLKVVAVARRARSLLDEQHDGSGRQVGLDDSLHHVRGADARHAADARLPAHLRVTVGHERAGSFVPDGDRPDTAAAGRSQLGMQCGRRLHAEQVLDTERLERRLQSGGRVRRTRRRVARPGSIDMTLRHGSPSIPGRPGSSDQFLILSATLLRRVWGVNGDGRGQPVVRESVLISGSELRVAVVGSGPAGFYAAGHLLAPPSALSPSTSSTGSRPLGGSYVREWLPTTRN